MYASAVGWGARRTLPRALRAPVYAGFARLVGADLREVERPLADYACFGAFFARGLRPGAREPDPDPRAVASPCDGTVSASGAIDGGSLLQAKGHSYRLSDLVASAELAAELEGGRYLTIYLAPRDYHRVHAPVAGSLASWEHIPGALFPVNERFAASVPRLFARNERVIARLETEHGAVVLVLVAAIGVGNVALRDREESLAPLPRGGASRSFRDGERPALARGDALGAFHLGSTVIALFAPGAFDLEAPPVGASIRCGARIGRVAGAREAGSDGRPVSDLGLDAGGGPTTERAT